MTIEMDFPKIWYVLALISFTLIGSLIASYIDKYSDDKIEEDNE